MELNEYKGMMDKVQIPENMDYRLKNRLLSSQKENKHRIYKKMVKRVAVVMVALVFVFGASQTSLVSNVTAAIKEYLGNFHLQAGKEEIDMGELVPVDIDFEAFKSAKGTEPVIGSKTRYWHDYSGLEELEEETGLHLWSSDEIKVSNISLTLDVYHQGLISCEFSYQGNRYTMNGMFVIAEGKDTWGYGTKVDPYRTYCYGDGQKAYFIKDEGYEGDEKGDPGIQVVYFKADNILYQLFVERSQEGTEMAENLIDIVAK